jgi:hypothetical protein
MQVQKNNTDYTELRDTSMQGLTYELKHNQIKTKASETGNIPNTCKLCSNHAEECSPVRTPCSVDATRMQMHLIYSASLAHESRGPGLAAVVEDEAEVDGQVELDAEDVALDGGAEADGGLEVDETLQERAARLRGRHGHLGLDQAQHVGAHAQLQRVAGAPTERGRRRGWSRRRRGGRRGSVAVGAAGAGHGEEHDHVDGQEKCDGGLACHCYTRISTWTTHAQSRVIELVELLRLLVC